MRFSAKTRYACIAMLELAASHGDSQPVRIKSIAGAREIPQYFLVQILLDLKRAGLVASLRGAAGGYQLTRGPDDISLADIINAIERRAVQPRAADSKPASPADAALDSVWEDMHAAQQRVLERLTLAELLRRVQQASAFAYQI